MGIRNDVVNFRNELEGFRQDLLNVLHEVREVKSRMEVKIPVVNPDGTPYLAPGENPYALWNLSEPRYLKDVVRWLEDVLDCKFYIIRTPDEEGGYDNP